MRTIHQFDLLPRRDDGFGILHDGRRVPYRVTRGDAFGYRGQWIFLRDGDAEPDKFLRGLQRGGFVSPEQAADKAVDWHLTERLADMLVEAHDHD